MSFCHLAFCVFYVFRRSVALLFPIVFFTITPHEGGGGRGVRELKGRVKDFHVSLEELIHQEPEKWTTAFLHMFFQVMVCDMGLLKGSSKFLQKVLPEGSGLVSLGPERH